MSKYTTELRYICESLVGLRESADESKVQDIITQAAPLIFSFDFPIHDESHRAELENKIIKHYYTREICAETFGRWKLFLDQRMNEIMPYYNQLYASAELEYNPLTDYKVTRIGGNKSNQKSGSQTTGSSETTNSNTNWNIFSDTPQGALENVENETYLTNATKDKADGKTSTQTSNGVNGTTDYNNDYHETVEGLAGGRSYAALINEYRKTMLNIDMRIIEELSDLFINIW